MNKVKVFSGIAVCMVAALSWLVLSKLREVDAGVCASSGTVLDDEQLRKAVISNIAKNMQGIVQHQDNEYLRGTIRFRVTDKISDDEIAKAVYELKDGRDSFDERFEFRDASRSQDFLKEPFVFLKYESGRGLVTYAGRISTKDIRQFEALEGNLGNFKLSLPQRLRGFGRNFYQITTRQFSYDCCLALGAENSPVRKLVPIVYKKVGERGAVIADRGLVKVAPVSNCGEILTYRGDSGFLRIKWTKGE